jgi:hypothetical protein
MLMALNSFSSEHEPILFLQFQMQRETHVKSKDFSQKVCSLFRLIHGLYVGRIDGRAKSVRRWRL